MSRRTAWLMTASLLASACAARSFQPQFTPPAAPKQAVVLSELIEPRPRSEQPVLVGLTTDPMRLFAWDLERGLLWEQTVTALSAPLVAADAIVLQEPEGVIVRDLASGRRRAVVDERGKLVSADGEGSRLVVTIAYDAKAAPGAVALVEGDSVRWKQQLNLPVGVAVLSGDYVMVPWATQRLSVLAASDGRELARHHFKSSVMGHALVDRGQLYVGQLGLTPVTAELLDQPGAKHTPYTPLKRSLPVQPPLLRDGYVPVPEPDNAQHRLQVGWRIRTGASGPSSENDLFMLRFYRMLFALDANADAVRWVRTFDQDLVGAAIQPGALLVVDAGGTLRWLDTAGNTRASLALGRELRVATLRPGTFVPHGAVVAALAPTNGAARADAAAPVMQPMAASVPAPPASAELPVLEPIAASLREQLFVAASLADDRLGAGRAYAVANLARFPEADATAELIALCAERKSPEPVRVAACAQLRDRTTGDAAVLATLRVRASFLEGTHAPPVGPLAQAAAKMQLKQAGTLLVSHVEDPNTPARDLVAIFEALQALGERSAAASVERFVRLHHAEPEGSELLPALASALRTLAALRVRAQRQTLVDVAADELTPLPTREQAKAALAQLDAPPPTAAPQAEPIDEKASTDEVQTDPRPYALGPDVVRRALAPVRDRLGRCLLADASRPHSGRTSMVVDATGRVEGVFVMPATLQPCVEPVLREARFPATRLGRQRITHIFMQPNATPKEPASSAAKARARPAVRGTSTSP